LADQKFTDSISEQIEAAARRSEIRELSLQVLTKKDPGGSVCGPLRPPSVESACMGLLNRQQQQQQQQHQHQQQQHVSSSSAHHRLDSAAHHRSDSATPKASTLSFLDGKLREMASSSISNSQKAATQAVQTESKAAPKLFGFSLHGKGISALAGNPSCQGAASSNNISSQETGTSEVGQKRPRANSWGPDESEIQRVNHTRFMASVDAELMSQRGNSSPGTRPANGNGGPSVVETASTTTPTTTSVEAAQRTNHVKNSNPVLQRVGPGVPAAGSKCMKTELGLELRPSRDPSVEAPWLRISATRNERVFN
jgi:hypothetical protein